MTFADREAVLRTFDVSRETARLLDLYVDQLTRWQAVKNLVGATTLQNVWSRHIADSLQLLALAPSASTWLDLGSGAGLPGLVLGIAGRERDDFSITLIESNARKCAFLREVTRLTGAAVAVRNARIEHVIGDHIGADVVCARAVAPLSTLLDWTEPLLKTRTIGLFPKGRDASSELTQASRRWNVERDLLPSRTDSAASIIRVTGLSPWDS